MTEGLDARVRLGCTIVLTRDLGEAPDPAEVVIELVAPGFSCGPLVVEGTIAKLLLFPESVGRHRIRVDASVGEGADIDHYVFGAEVAVEMDRTEFCLKVYTAHMMVQQAYLELANAASRLGGAYMAAWKAHSEVLDRARERSRDLDDLQNKIMWDCVFVFAGGALGSAARIAAEQMGLGKMVADGVKDLTKYGVESAVPGWPQFSGPVFAPITIEPDAMERAMRERLNEETLRVLGLMTRWSSAATSNEPSFLLDFDPEVVVTEHLTVAGQQMAAFAHNICPDWKKTGREMETAIWAEWLESFAYTVEDIQVPPWLGFLADPRAIQCNVDPNIVARLDAILPGGAESFVREHGGVALERAREELGEVWR